MTHNLYITYLSGNQMIPGCGFCIYVVPCFCDIATDESFFHVNLPIALMPMDPHQEYNLLIWFYCIILWTRAILAYWGWHTLSWVNVIVNPKSLFVKNNISDIIANDKNTDLSLRRITDAMKNDQAVFQNLADPVLIILTTQIRMIF